MSYVLKVDWAFIFSSLEIIIYFVTECVCVCVCDRKQFFHTYCYFPLLVHPHVGLLRVTSTPLPPRTTLTSKHKKEPPQHKCS